MTQEEARLASSTWTQDREAITRALKARRYRSRRSDQGELWLDGRCLFHEDLHQSASWQEESGVYYCRTEDLRYGVPFLLKALALPTAERSGDNGGSGVIGKAKRARRAQPSLTAVVESGGPERPPPSLAQGPIDVYDYVFPDGTLSHRKFRQGDGKDKKIWQEGPHGESNIPQDRWPLYGDPDLEPGTHVLVVEGEKKVDRVAAMGDSFQGGPIRALTAGGVSDLRKHAQTLASRLAEFPFPPGSLVCWPDNDEPGLRAMAEIAKALRAAGLPHRVLRPADYRLGHGQDVVDFLDQGGSLAGVFADLWGQGQKTENLIQSSICTEWFQVVFPGTRRLVRLEPGNVQALVLQAFGYVPAEKESRELLAQLRRKSLVAPTPVVTRLYQGPDAVWWRPAAVGKAYHVSAAGVTTADDPPEAFIAVPSETLQGLVEVDLGGGRQDLEELCRAFHLNQTEIAMIEGWLVTAFCGLQAPILLFRSPAGTGKSTLARLLCSVLEPVVPEIDASEERNQDPRQFLRLLQRIPVALLDNVSRLSSGMEDVLSKLVTGYTTGIRALYEDSAEVIHLRRAVLITTINWDVYKGDLATRLVAVQPQTESELSWLSDRGAQQRFGPLIPRIRGHLFHCASRYFQERARFDRQTLPFRIGDLGLVFACLGHDVAYLAEQEAHARAELVSLYDLWLESLVALWKDEDSIEFSKSTLEIVHWMREYGIREPPDPKSPKLARYLAEKAPMFRDFGFHVERYRTASFNGYRFRKISAAEYQTMLPVQE